MKSAIKEMKRGKHDGNLGLCSDHVKDGSERLYTYTAYGPAISNFMETTQDSFPLTKHSPPPVPFGQ